MKHIKFKNIASQLLIYIALGVTPCLTYAQMTEPWIAEGPAPIIGGQVEGITDRKTVGAMSSLAPHPTDADSLYVSGVNGGIWKTNNATDASPIWTSMLEAGASLSMSDIQFDPTDNTHNTLVASMGRFSSFARRGSKLRGIYRTTNGGTDWEAIDGGGQLNGLNIKSIAARGNIILISVVRANSGIPGVYKSVDTGGSWSIISTGNGSGPTGLPGGESFDIAADPSDTNRLYTTITGSNGGIFRSDNLGETWIRVSNAAMDIAASAPSIDNIEISVGSSNNPYVIMMQNGRPFGMFHSNDGGTTWAEMDLPVVGTTSTNPAGQGEIHLSIAADLSQNSIVYVGGDRQDFDNNIIGAQDFSGRLMRGDASQASGSQWVHLTHNNALGPAGGGTANNSSPHADSRDMAIDANGQLIEVDDGGVFRRTSPLDNTGDWFSMNTNLQTTELHKSQYDSVSQIIIGGAQDNGLIEKIQPGNNQWETLLSGDGSVVMVDTSTLPSMSIRYISAQFLRSFLKIIVNSSNTITAIITPSLTPLDGAVPLVPQFYIPHEINKINPNRIIFGAANGVYESFDQGDTIRLIGPGLIVTQIEGDAIAYGAGDNQDILYIGSVLGEIHIRSDPAPAPLIKAASFPGTGIIADIVIHPDTAANAFVVTASDIYMTDDIGMSWTNINNNINTFNTGPIRSIEFINHPQQSAIIIGTDSGVLIALESENFADWSVAGAGLPTVPVYAIDYTAIDNQLTIGTLGRGAWSLTPNFTDSLFEDGFE